MKLTIFWFIGISFVMWRAFSVRPEMLDMKRFTFGSTFLQLPTVSVPKLATSAFHDRVRKLEARVKPTVPVIYTAHDASWFYTYGQNQTLLWKFKPIGEHPSRLMSSIIVGDRIFIGTNNGPLYALNKLSGDVIWIINAVMIEFNVSPTILDDSLVFVIDRSAAPGSFVARIDQASGQVLWQSQLLAGHASVPAIYDKAAGAVAVTTIDGRLHILNASDGTQLGTQ